MAILIFCMILIPFFFSPWMNMFFYAWTAIVNYPATVRAVQLSWIILFPLWFIK